MNKEEFKQRFKNYLIMICTVFITIALIMGINFLFVSLSDEVKNVNYAIALSNHIEENNLILPFPFKHTIPIVGNTVFDQYTTFYLDNFNKGLYDFHELLKQNYYYDELYDCKYWAYVWTLYYKENKNEHNWHLKYLDTDNHVFVMVYNESGYIIMDGDEMIVMMRN